jgi:hypothetical protein
VTLDDCLFDFAVGVTAGGVGFHLFQG